MRGGLAGLVGLIVGGCGSVSSQPDAASMDAGSDATSARCDVAKAFGPPVPVAGVNTNLNDAWGWLSADHLTIYFARDGGGTAANLYSAIRPQPSGPFTDVTLLGGVNTTDYESRPSVTADSLTLFMEVSIGGGAGDIHVATRTSTAAAFSVHAPVAVINTASSTDWNPWISDDGLVMYFVSDRTGTFDIFKTMRTSTSSPFSAPVVVGELNTTANDYDPVLSKDGLEIFFGSTRDQSGTNVLNQIFHATRSTPSDGFGAPARIAELSNATSDDFPNWVSPDRCQLMFTSNRGGGSGGYDIWIATRSQ